MQVYIIAYFFFTIFALFNLFISERKRILIISLMSILGIGLIILAGLRWNTGTDWDSYLYYYNQIERRPFADSGMEIGYEILTRIFRYIFGEGYTYFLFFCASFIIVFTYLTIFRLSPFPLFSLFLLFSYSLVSSGFGVRQDLAICLTLFSTIFIISRSLYKYLFIIILASLIHSSTIIFIPAYWIFSFKWNWNKVIILIVIICVSAFLSKSMLNTFGGFVAERKVELYLEMGEELKVNPLITLAKGLVGRLMFLGLCGFSLWKYGKYNNAFYGIFNLYFFGVLIYLITTPINPIFNRLARFYEIYQILIIPLAYYYSNRVFKIVIFVLVTSFSFFKFNSSLKDWQGTFSPYKTIFDKH